jgi:hypothetical protein
MENSEQKIIPLPIAQELELDAVVCDILQRIIEGIEPFVREEFAGCLVPARDLSIGIDVIFTHLLAANENKPGISAKERARRAKDLEKSSSELRRLAFRLCDASGLIELPGCSLPAA